MLDLAIVHRSAGGAFGAGYHRSLQRFAAKHAGRLAKGSGAFAIVDVPAATLDEARAFFEDGRDLAPLQRELYLRCDRITNNAGHRPKAMLMNGAWDAAKARRREGVVAADPPTRNGPCTCGSGKRYKDCHGGVAPPTG